MPGQQQGTTSERYMRAFSASLAACTAHVSRAYTKFRFRYVDAEPVPVLLTALFCWQVQAYGKCIAARLPEVRTGTISLVLLRYKFLLQLDPFMPPCLMLWRQERLTAVAVLKCPFVSSLSHVQPGMCADREELLSSGI